MKLGIARGLRIWVTGATLGWLALPFCAAAEGAAAQNGAVLATTPTLYLERKPNLKFPTLKAYEQAVGGPGAVVEGACVEVFAPKWAEAPARIIQDYLTRAYMELYRTTGVATRYKITVYHFPQGNPNFTGGTSDCVIYFDDTNLDLAHSDEYTQHKIPHVAGYIEMMADNFVDVTHAEFGWGMLGWSLGVAVTQKVADNPIYARALAETHQNQLKTFMRYRSAGNVFPPDIPANLCDRIHAYVLWSCEVNYGPNFYADVFREIRAAQGELAAAAKNPDADASRNARYKITLECINRLPNVNFKELLQRNGISLNVDVKSLHPTAAGWNHKFMETAS